MSAFDPFRTFAGELAAANATFIAASSNKGPPTHAYRERALLAPFQRSASKLDHLAKLPQLPNVPDMPRIKDEVMKVDLASC